MLTLSHLPATKELAIAMEKKKKRKALEVSIELAKKARLRFYLGWRFQE